MKHFAPPAISPAPGSTSQRADFASMLSGTRLACFLLLFAALPLLWPSVPPLVDLPNHLSRYRVDLDYTTSPQFRQWFEVHHVLVGNLGVDLIVRLLGHTLDLELLVKLVAIAIPLLTVSGVLLIAQEVHGKIGPLTALSAVFAYNFPFNYGFLNYTLSAALALNLFALWIRLGRLDRTGLRAALFLPVGCVLWLCHVAGWGLFGLMAFTWDVADARHRGTAWPRALRGATVACLTLAAPLVPMLFWSSHIPGKALVEFSYSPTIKFIVFFMGLRDGVQLIDALSVFLLWTIAMAALVRDDIGLDRRLLAISAVLTTAYAAMPPTLLGSCYADMRIVPYAMILLLLALRSTRDSRFSRALAIGAPIFFAAQMLYHGVNYARLDRIYRHHLEALDHIPMGSRVFALARITCGADMSGDRLNHLHRLATVRRHAFTNSNWAYPSTQTILARPEMVAGYDDDSSAFLAPTDCNERRHRTLGRSLNYLPRERYRYLWLLGVPERRWPHHRAWLHEVWRNDVGVLYAIDPPSARRRS